MNIKLSKLVKKLDEISHLYEEDPCKIFFLLLLMLNDDPLSDDELENLIAEIGNSFHNHGESSKVASLMNKIRSLRAEARKNSEFHNLISSKMSALIQTPAVLEYLRKHKHINHSNNLSF
jgi:hypothetical protein